jgi:hypothetical protein
MADEPVEQRLTLRELIDAAAQHRGQDEQDGASHWGLQNGSIGQSFEARPRTSGAAPASSCMMSRVKAIAPAAPAAPA